MRPEEIETLLEENWGDWKAVFDIIIENNLHFEGDCIYDSDDILVWDGITSGMYLDETCDLICKYFNLYYTSKSNNSSPLSKRKSKYISLC